MTIIRIRCPTCAGTGWWTHEDRHTRTRKDVCSTCAGTGLADAGTGQKREASFDPSCQRALNTP